MSGSRSFILACIVAFGVSSPASASEIVGMAIDGSNNFVFTWYDDGTVTAGTTNDLSSRRSAKRYKLPRGKQPRDIVGMAIDGGNNFVFAWYRDGTVSAGTSVDLGSRRSPYRFSLPTGKTPDDIVGMGIDGRNNNVFAWYADGTVSAGTSDDLDARRKPYPFALADGKNPANVKAMAIDGFVLGKDGSPVRWKQTIGKVVEQNWISLANDALGIARGTGTISFVWYDDGMVTAGKSNDLAKIRVPYAYQR